MTPKHLLPAILILFFTFCCKAQNLKDITIHTSYNKTNIKTIEFIAGNIAIGITPKGNVKLRPLSNGNFTYWQDLNGDYRTGKLKSIDDTQIDYYDSFSDASITGKLKTIGTITVTY
jgi:hypothetical protein